MASASKRVRSLRALFRQIPEDHEILSILFDLSTQADRTAAIVGAAILEDRLRRTLARYLKSDVKDDEQDSLFSEADNGPLSTFDAKTRLAYCLGIFNKNAKEDFDNIRRIRNGFAHSIPHHAFSSDEIKTICENFWIVAKSFKEDLGLPDAILQAPWDFISPKGLYVLAIGLHHWQLTIHYPVSYISP